MSQRVAVLRGDGIGPEVIEIALADLDRSFEIVDLDVGTDRWIATGETLNEADLDVIRTCDAVLFGAVGDPRVPDGVLERGVILRLRTELDLYINLRPFPELGVTIVRENTEGLYTGTGDRSDDLAREVSINTTRCIERCMTYAFDLALRNGSGRVTLVHKTNVLRHAGALWKDVAESVAASYAEVALHYEHVDAAAYHLVKDPHRYEVIVTDNMFGDILADVAAAVSGGLGRAASANLHPDPVTRPSRCIGLFEPVHGSAPDIAGTGNADPTAAIRAVHMLNSALASESVTA